ncbi:MAG: hypothetical protein PF689_01730 [Deltaproteobacteria bacterium]|nr:hypothetical protein [Deltaproteobacteria bacterium]
MRIISGSKTEPKNKNQIRFIREDSVSPDWALAAGKHLFTSFQNSNVEVRPTLIISQINSPAIVIGQFQNSLKVLKDEAWDKYPVYRRITGGGAAFFNKGVVHIAFVVPDYQQFLGVSALKSIPKKLNNILLSTLREEGLSLSLQTADVLTKKGFKVGGIGFECQNSVAFFECWLGIEQSIDIPDNLYGYPKLSDDTYSWKSKSVAELVSDESLIPAWDSEFAHKVSFNMESPELEVDEVEWKWLDKERINGLRQKQWLQKASETLDDKFSISKLVEDYSGFIHAAVSVPDGNIIQKVKLFGDFQADADGIRELEEKLEWTSVKKRSIALIIDDVLVGSRNHIILGIKRLGSILEAIMDGVVKEKSK